MGTTFRGINHASVFYDDTLSTERWIDAFGKDVVKFLLDPGMGVPVDDQTGDPTGWNVTMIETGGGGDSTVVNALTVGVALLITTDNADFDGVNMQVKGEQFKIEANKELYFGCKFTASEATDSDLFIGLCETLTALMKPDSAHGIAAANVEGAFLVKVDAATTLYFKTYKDGAETNTATLSAVLDTDPHIFEMYWDGALLKGYLDGSLIATFSADMPDGDLTPSICFRTGAASVETLDVYWLRAIECR